MRLKNSIAFFIALILSASPLHADQDQMIRVVIHAHGHASGEKLGYEELAQLAKMRGVDAIVITDYFQQRVRIPLWGKITIPFEKESLKKYGIERYYRDLQHVNEKGLGVLLIAGSEVTPSYYWSGSIVRGDLTVHNLQKNLLVMGLDAQALSGIPTYENLKNDESGTDNDQKVCDYVAEHGGISIWSTPDDAFGTEFKKGPIRFSTLPYPDRLLRTRHYTGVAVYPEGMNDSGRIGGLWDQLLVSYLSGKRAQPVWAFAEAVLHEQNIRENMGAWDQMVFVPSMNTDAILAAFKSGRFYVRDNRQLGLWLTDFRIVDAVSGQYAEMGGEITAQSPIVVASARLPDKGIKTQLILRIIKNGEMVHEEKYEGSGIELKWEDPRPGSEIGRSYYRVTIDSNKGNMMTNPIFVSSPSANSQR